MRYEAAAIQYEPSLGDKDRNVARLSTLAREAVASGARLVVLPEMCTTGYRFRSVEEIDPLLEPVPQGPTIRHFRWLSNQLGAYLVVGLPERDPATGRRYNTTVLLGPAGFVGKYRKVHLYDDDAVWAAEGDLGFPVFSTPLGRIAMVICMDLVFMESCRVAALAGADVIAAPVNWSASAVTWWARALENGTYLVCANRWGEERGAIYCGRSAIIGPDGETLSTLDRGDGFAHAEVDTDAARQCRTSALARRRPERYRSAVTGASISTAGAGTPRRQIRVAAGQGRAAEAMKEQIRRASVAPDEEASSPLQLMVFPFCEHAGATEYTPLLAAAASEAGCHVVWGSSDASGQRTAWLVSPDGRVERYCPGRVTCNSGQVFNLPWGRLGLALGDDLLDPEAVRSLALSGADVVAVPTDWPEGSPRWLWQIRWMENETPVVVANYAGGSRIWHAGRPRPEAGVGSYAVIGADVAVGGAKAGFRCLRPSWYSALTEG